MISRSPYPLHTLLYKSISSIAFLAALALVLTACASSRTASPSTPYTGTRPVERVYAYIFLDPGMTHVHLDFRTEFEARLKSEFAKSGVACESLWFSDLAMMNQANLDRQKLDDNMTRTPVGAAIEGNAKNDIAFQPTHRLLVLPRDFRGWGDQVIMVARWDMMDAATWHDDWNVHTSTPGLFENASKEDSKRYADSLVDTIMEEMRYRKVIPGA